MMSFKMVDLNLFVYERSAAFKINEKDQQTVEIERYARKRIYHVCWVHIEKSVLQDHRLASLVLMMPDSDLWKVFSIHT